MLSDRLGQTRRQASRFNPSANLLNLAFVAACSATMSMPAETDDDNAGMSPGEKKADGRKAWSLFWFWRNLVHLCVVLIRIDVGVLDDIADRCKDVTIERSTW